MNATPKLNVNSGARQVYKIFESQNILKVFRSKKSKTFKLYIGYGGLCLREESVGLNDNYMVKEL